ncbi:cation:proton antiporter [Pseudoalteromonas aurantia]|uniref:Sodium:proton antiporter n=1 Tax=Pseudoalteromonas aurantia TaxID=43654 RepID=A0ABY2VZF2_9GAMM|nr:cation:proton antiporter [Pseudoalteromonas aurantia]TMO75910.1 sodium:proton antiporter [Pseudoalteromonas aurantia]
MIYYILASAGLVLFIYSISVRQLVKAEITAPILFVTLGAVISYFVGKEAVVMELDSDIMLPMVEVILAVVLFSDAARTRLRVLYDSYQLPLRLLLVGLPLTILFGAIFAYWLLPLSWIGATLLAVIISPTDAALCKGFLSEPRVPVRLREAINVESGLNDGLCVPIFLFLLPVVVYGENATLSALSWLFFRELSIACVIAIVVTWISIVLMRKAKTHHLFATTTSPFLFISVATLVFSLTQALHGSGFIAAFVCGLLFDRFYDDPIKDTLLKDSEHIADFATLLIWTLFGMISLNLLSQGVNIDALIFAVFAIILIRTLPIILCLMGSDTRLHERITLAWFGPKGLASVVFILMLMTTMNSDVSLIIEAAVYTVLLSIFMHGVSTRPISLSFK